MKKSETGRYENKTTNEFWIAEVNGRFVTIQFGNIGSEGYRASREFSTYEQAIAFAIKRLEAKIEEGYRRPET